MGFVIIITNAWIINVRWLFIRRSILKGFLLVNIVFMFVVHHKFIPFFHLLLIVWSYKDLSNLFSLVQLMVISGLMLLILKLLVILFRFYNFLNSFFILGK